MGAGAQSKACEVNTLPSKSYAQPHVSFFEHYFPGALGNRAP